MHRTCYVWSCLMLIYLNVSTADVTTVVSATTTDSPSGGCVLLRPYIMVVIDNLYAGDKEVRFSCSENFTLIGASSVHCDNVTKRFVGIGSEPYCTPNECSLEPPWSIDSANTLTGSVEIRISCIDDNHTLIGTSSVHCDNDTTPYVEIKSQPFCIPNDAKDMVLRKRCPNDTDARGTVWTEMTLNSIVSIGCSELEGHYTGTISRECSMTGVWEEPFYNCTRVEFEQALTEIKAHLSVKNGSQVDVALSKLSIATNKTLFEGEIAQSVGILKTAINIGKTKNHTTNAENEAFFRTTSNLLDTQNKDSSHTIGGNLSGRTTIKNGFSGGFNVIQLVDDYSEVVAASLKSSETRHISTKNMEVQITTAGDGGRDDILFPTRAGQVIGPTHLFLSKESLIGSRSYVAVLYNNLIGVIPGSKTSSGNLELNSAVLSLTLLPYNQDSLRTPLGLTFKHLKKNYAYPRCSYWSFERNEWESEGCSLQSSSDDSTVCRCSHLTNFAILMSPWLKDNVDTLIIDIITYVGCSVSSISLAVTILMHMYLWRYIKSDRVVILINLSLALIISYGVFLAGIRQTENQMICTGIAIALHYIYLAAFMLMLAEGIAIGVTVLYVSHKKSRLGCLLPLAWGIPAVIVGAAAYVTKLDGYGTEHSCWLSTDYWLIWSFVGPVLLVILINFVILILVLRTFCGTEAVKKKSAIEKTRSGIWCLCVLLPVMGVSWVLGVFYVSEETAWVQYAFAGLNSSQGLLIFACHCVFNEKVRTAMRKVRRQYNYSGNSSRPNPSSRTQSRDAEMVVERM